MKAETSAIESSPKRLRLASVFALAAALIPRAAMLVVGLYALRLLGVEAFGAFSLAFATGVGLLQFLPDAISVYFARLRWVGASSVVTRSSDSRTAKVAAWAALLAFIAQVLAIGILIPLLYCVEPYSSDHVLRQATVILALASPLFGVGLVLTTQLTINGYERAGMLQALVLGAGQLTLPIMGGYLGGVIGLSVGLFGAMAIFSLYALWNGRRLLFSRKSKSGGRLLSWPQSNSRDVLGLGRLALSMLLGAPVHWFVLRLLGASENGLAEVGKFAYAYYFYTFMILVPSSLQGYLVGTLTRARARSLELGGQASTSPVLIGYVTLAAAGTAVLFAAVHALVSPVALGGDSLERMLPGYISIVSGGIGMAAIVASQRIMSGGHFVIQLNGTIVSAGVYLGFSWFAIHSLGMGAAAVAGALGLGQALQLAYFAGTRWSRRER